MKNPQGPSHGGVSFVFELKKFCGWILEKTFALRFFARQLAGTANGLGLFAGTLLRRFLEMLPKLHFTEHAFALQLLFQGTKRLIDIVVANTDLHVVSPPF